MNVFKDNIFLSDYFFLQKNNKIFFFKEKFFLEEIQKGKKIENYTFMMYKTLVEQCSNRKEELCMFCRKEMEQEEFVVKICNNFHFICFKCKVFSLKNLKKCFLCKEEIKEEYTEYILQNVAGKAEKQIFLYKQMPDLFYIENHVKIFPENTKILKQQLLFFCKNISIQVFIEEHTKIDTEVYKNLDEEMSLKNISLNLLNEIKKGILKNNLSKYKDIYNKYLWITIELKNLKNIENYFIPTDFCFLEVKSFWKTSEEEFNLFVKWFYNQFKKSLDIEKFKDFIKEFYDKEDIVFCFISSSTIFLELSEIEKHQEKTYIVLQVLNGVFLNTSYNQKEQQIPKNVFFYLQNGKANVLEDFIVNTKNFVFIDGKKTNLINNFFLRKIKNVEFLYIIEREIDYSSFKKNVQELEYLEIFCNKKRFLKNIFESEKKIYLKNNENFSLKGCSINLLSLFEFDLKKQKKKLLCEAKGKNHVEYLFNKKNEIIRIGNINIIELNTYAIDILPKFCFSEDDNIELLVCVDYLRKKNEKLSKYQDSSIFVGKIQNIILKQYSIGIFPKLKFSSNSELSSLFFSYKEQDVSLENIIDLEKPFFVLNVKTIYLTMGSLDLIKSIEANGSFTLELFLLKFENLKQIKEKLIELKHFIEKKTWSFLISFSGNRKVKMDGFSFMKNNKK